MNTNSDSNPIINMQKVLIGIIIAIFIISTIGSWLDPDIGILLSTISIIVLLILTLVRIMGIARYFKNRNDLNYRILSYIVIFILVLSAGIKYLTT